MKSLNETIKSTNKCEHSIKLLTDIILGIEAYPELHKTLKISKNIDKELNEYLEKINKEGTYERLSPGQRIGFNYYLLSGKDYKTNVTITWEDDFSLSNKINMTLFALNQAY